MQQAVFSLKVLGMGLAAALALVPVTASAQTVAALPTPRMSLDVLGAAKPLAAWIDFCQAYATECAVDTAEPTRIVLTPAVWSMVNAVNRRINRSIEAVTDPEHWGRPDHWDLAEDGRGDCEDFQLLKRRLLADAGLPRRAMRMTVVIDEKGEGHAVLTLLTDRGEFILDNKTSAVLPWQETGYTFIKRESQEAVAWVSLGGVTPPTTTANR
ncbi:transglutaminase-like cysteine peptidase [Methylobacterium organophilum]|uniref:Transglutaminase n=1 Tax=Methylobacterium organophilum TaxID=410 RepID=A0ABQ4T3E7_METOR|nr:transglutaminase-like cysteine peptidase [Methylobacterium organophilum]GJE26053.1 hypothetical protein LKMONMHP_0897 [Methylobacterium organophilum]